MRDAEYHVVCAGLAHDCKQAIEYNLRKTASTPTNMLLRPVLSLLLRVGFCCCCTYRLLFYDSITPQVLHLRNQLEIGGQLADSFMQKRALMICNDRTSRDSLVNLMRKVTQEASERFENISMESMRHLVYVDLTKHGRLSAPDIDNMATMCHKVLQLNPDRSNLLQLAPMLLHLC